MTRCDGAIYVPFGACQTQPDTPLGFLVMNENMNIIERV